MESVIARLHTETDKFMYAVKHYSLIEKDLIGEGKIQANQPPKNGIGTPVYDTK